MLRKIFSEVVSVSEKHGRKKDHHGENTLTRGSRRRKWQPTPVLLPRKSHRWRSLVGYNPWGCKEWDTTERLHGQAVGSGRVQELLRIVFLLRKRCCWQKTWKCLQEANRATRQRKCNTRSQRVVWQKLRLRKYIWASGCCLERSEKMLQVSVY